MESLDSRLELLERRCRRLQSATFASFEVYIVITAMYLVMSIGFSAAFSLIEKAAFRYPLSR